jgi:hypothetical protein
MLALYRGGVERLIEKKIIYDFCNTEENWFQPKKKTLFIGKKYRPRKLDYYFV